MTSGHHPILTCVANGCNWSIATTVSGSALNGRYGVESSHCVSAQTGGY